MVDVSTPQRFHQSVAAYDLRCQQHHWNYARFHSPGSAMYATGARQREELLQHTACQQTTAFLRLFDAWKEYRTCEPAQMGEALRVLDLVRAELKLGAITEV